MAVANFTDFEPYSDTIAHVDLRMRVLGFQQAAYSLSLASVGQLQVQWAQEGSGQLSEGATVRDGIGLYMLLSPCPSILNSMPLDPNAIVFFPPGSEFCFSCKDPNSWFSILIPLTVLADISADPIAALPSSVTVLRPERTLVNRLRRLVPGYLRALTDTPTLDVSHAAQQAFQQEILSVAREICFRCPPDAGITSEDSSHVRIRHDQLAIHAAEIIEAGAGVTHTVAQIAEILNVSERTLATAFQSRFGMPPRRFIQTMRLNRARALLREQEAARTRVSEVAATCGYWDFGRFASRYQQLFGELPSTTLRR